MRKNAVFAVYAIYREFEHLIPDAPELIQTFLAAESDATCKRNAFVFLAQCSMPKAVEYILQVFDQIPTMDELLQMSIIEVIRLDCKRETTHKVSDGDCESVRLVLTSCALGAVHPPHLRAAQRVLACRQVRGCDHSHFPHSEPGCRQGYVMTHTDDFWTSGLIGCT